MDPVERVGEPPIDVGRVVAEFKQGFVHSGAVDCEHDVPAGRSTEMLAPVETANESNIAASSTPACERSKAERPNSDAASEDAARRTAVRARSYSRTRSCLSRARTADS